MSAYDVINHNTQHTAESPAYASHSTVGPLLLAKEDGDHRGYKASPHPLRAGNGPEPLPSEPQKPVI